MQIDPFTGQPPMAHIERAHASINAAYDAIALDRETDDLATDVPMARRYLTQARTELEPMGHEALDDASRAARAMLPRLDHALALLEALGTANDPDHVRPFLDELGIAMDQAEAALAGVGWD